MRVIAWGLVVEDMIFGITVGHDRILKIEYRRVYLVLDLAHVVQTVSVLPNASAMGSGIDAAHADELLFKFPVQNEFQSLHLEVLLLAHLRGVVGNQIRRRGASRRSLLVLKVSEEFLVVDIGVLALPLIK